MPLLLCDEQPSFRTPVFKDPQRLCATTIFRIWQASKRPAPKNWTMTSKPMRVILLFAAVISLTLVAACTGFLICCCRQRQKKRRRLVEFQARVAQSNTGRSMESTAHPQFFDGSYVQDHSTDIQNSLLSCNAFEGRELELYRKERKSKRKDQVVIRSSQYIELPIQVNYLRPKTKALYLPESLAMAHMEPQHLASEGHPPIEGSGMKQSSYSQLAESPKLKAVLTSQAASSTLNVPVKTLISKSAPSTPTNNESYAAIKADLQHR